MYKRSDKMPMLWEWIREARAVGQKMGKIGPSSGVHTEDRSSCIGRKKEEI